MGLREVILEDRPVLYYSMGFRGNPNLATIDNEAGPDLNATLNDLSALGQAGSVEPGVLGTTWRWDGTGGRRLTLGYDARIDVTKVTVECVVALTQAGTIRCMWDRDNDAALQWSQRFTASGEAMFYMREAGGTFRIATGTTVLTSAEADPRFHHIVATWDHGSSGPNSGGGRIFVNGKEEAFVAGSEPLRTDSGAGVYFGARMLNDQVLEGYSAHSAYYDYALSPHRILAHARAARAFALPGPSRTRSRLR